MKLQITKLTLSPCLLVTLSAIFLAACSSPNMLTRRYNTARPGYGDTALPNPGPDAPPPPVTIINPAPSQEITPTIETTITGTWTFTTPTTTTCMEHKTPDFHQFSLYLGRPAPTDTPFVVITVSPTAKPLAESDPKTYKVAHTRTYTLNGNIAQEWTGTTHSGAGFCELILTKPGINKGDVCHAIATSKDDQTQKLALEILTSLTWKKAGE